MRKETYGADLDAEEWRGANPHRVVDLTTALVTCYTILVD